MGGDSDVGTVRSEMPSANVMAQGVARGMYAAGCAALVGVPMLGAGCSWTVHLDRSVALCWTGIRYLGAGHS